MPKPDASIREPPNGKAQIPCGWKKLRIKKRNFRQVVMYLTILRRYKLCFSFTTKETAPWRLQGIFVGPTGKQCHSLNIKGSPPIVEAADPALLNIGDTIVVKQNFFFFSLHIE